MGGRKLRSAPLTGLALLSFVAPMTTVFEVGDAVAILLKNGRRGEGYVVESLHSGNRLKCRRLKDGRVTKKLSVASVELARPESKHTQGDSSHDQVASLTMPPALPRVSNSTSSVSSPPPSSVSVSSSTSADSPLTRISLAQLSSSKGMDLMMEALKRDSLFVVTDLGAKFERAYDLYLDSVKEFFLQAPLKAREACISGKIYCNQRRTPMWYCGYESTDIRQCFRVPGGYVTGGSEFIDKWPSLDEVATGTGSSSTSDTHKEADKGVQKCEFEKLWQKLTRMMQGLCDLCLKKTLRRHARNAITTDNDLSVSYTFHCK